MSPRARKGLVLAALLSVGLGRPGFSEDPLRLFHKMQEALGGAEKLAAVRDFEQTVRAESFDAEGRSMGDVRKRTRWIHPSTIRLDQVGPGSTYVLYFDGKSGWEILPGAQEAVELAGGELKFAQEYVRGFFLRTWLADRDPRYRITSPAERVVRISDGDPAHQLDVTLDPTSWLPIKESSMTLSDPAHPTSRDSVTSEWVNVGGLRFPSRFTVFRSGVRVAEATGIDETRVNSGLKVEDLSAKPSDRKPVFARPIPPK
jgi:hypothetical protein